MLRQKTPPESWTWLTLPDGAPRSPGACFTSFGTIEKSTFASACFFVQSSLVASSGPVTVPD